MPFTSVAVHVIVVVPTGYGAFRGWLSLRVPTMVPTAQLSVAVAVPGFTVAEQEFGSALVVMLAGGVTTGTVLSMTVTFCVSMPTLPLVSVAV